MRENETAWRLWNILSGFDRPTVAGPAGEMRLVIRSLDAITLCEKYAATMEDFENILAIETVAYPLLSAKWERAKTASEGQGA